jgi:hypothetical protein
LLRVTAEEEEVAEVEEEEEAVEEEEAWDVAILVTEDMVTEDMDAAMGEDIMVEWE